jgi:hypothetical protein
MKSAGRRKAAGRPGQLSVFVSKAFVVFLA